MKIHAGGARQRRARCCARALAVAMTISTAALSAPASGSVHENDGTSSASRLVLDEGHIDLFEVSYSSASGQLELQVKDDTGLYAGPDDPAVYRDPEDVVVALPTDRAAFTVTEDVPQGYQDFLGPPGTVFYYTDEIQTDGLPWPGWSSERLPAQLEAGGVVLEDSAHPAYEDVPTVDLVLQISGPGEVFTWMNGAESPIYTFVDTRTPEPDLIPVPVGSHVHSAWGFTEPGTYVIEATPSAPEVGGGTLTGETRTYRFIVGGPDVLATRAPRLVQSAAEVRVGERLSVVPGEYSPTDPLLSTRWFLDGELVGYDDTYVVPARQFPTGPTSVARRLQAVITARREGWTTTRVTVADHAILPGVAPRPVTAPRILGSARVGKRLRVTPGTWSPSAACRRYQWFVGGTAVPGARSPQLVLARRWKGQRVSARVTATRDGHRAGAVRTVATSRVAPRRH